MRPKQKSRCGTIKIRPSSDGKLNEQKLNLLSFAKNVTHISYTNKNLLKQDVKQCTRNNKSSTTRICSLVTYVIRLAVIKFESKECYSLMF